MAGPAVKDLEIFQGDTYELEIRLRDVAADGTLGAYIDLTGSTLKAQIRTTKPDTVVQAEFTVSLHDQVDPNTRGGATLSLTPGQTGSLAGDASLLWDMQRTDSLGKVRTLLRGVVKTVGEVTR